jgi:outer membrane autotransporter protein
VTVQGKGDIVFSSTDDSRGSVYASDSAIVSVGNPSSQYNSITADGEVLAVDSSRVSLYADAIVINRSDSDAAVSSENGSTVVIGSSDTSSITTTGEVLSTSGEDGSASSITLTAANITMNYSPNPLVETDYGGGEDHTLYADGGSSIAVNATGTVTITGPVGATDSGSSITIDGSTISITHNTVGAGNYTLEGRGIHVENDASIRIGSDSTSTLTIDVENSSGNSSITVAGNDSTLELYGNTISITTADGILNGDLSSTSSLGTSYEGGTLTIGSDSTDSLTINSLMRTVGEGASTTLLGSSISVTGNVGTYNGAAATIGSSSTNLATLAGTVDVYGSGSTLTVDGTNISLTETAGGSGATAYPAAAIYGGTISLGSSETESLTIAGTIAALSSYNGTDTADTAISLDGTTIDLEGGAVATGSGASITVGGAGVTQALTGALTAADGGVISAVLSGTYTGDAVASGAGTLKLTAESAAGDLTAEGSGSTLTATLSGALAGSATASDSATLTLTADSMTGNLAATDSGSSLTADIAGSLTGDSSVSGSSTLTLTAASITGALSTSDSGTLTAAVSDMFTGKTTDDADTMTLNLGSGAVWNLTDSSTVSTLNADGANISLMDGVLGQTLTTGTFAGDGVTVYLDADGTTNTGNDHVYITGTHTGTTSLHLSSTSNTWSGALGTVLVSVGDEEGSFVSDGETEAALYYYDLKLASTTENVTDGYNTDWYLSGFTKNATNSEGYHTTVVRNLVGITGSNYLLWRSDMDTLFRRLGETDGSLIQNTDNGVWVRAKGKKFSRGSDFFLDSKYSEYEAGYDWLHEKTDKKEHVMGVGFAYLNGDAAYVTGKGDLDGYSLAFYDTHVWKNGQYLDLTFKGSRYKNEFGYTALSRYIDGQLSSTGFTLGAEYGYKIKSLKGWFVEPQAQFVLGHFRNDAFTDSNGVHVNGETIRTGIVRIGARAGFESQKLSAFAKINWYHDFGGNHVTSMSFDTDSLRIREDYSDSWFSYGLGAAYKINDKTQGYFDLEWGDGSSYDENWSWEVGLRFFF